MPGVEPEVAVWRRADIGHVRGRSRAQAAPERRPCEIAGFGKERPHIVEYGIATLEIEIARIARKFSRAGNAQAIAQIRIDKLILIVRQARSRRTVRDVDRDRY